MYERIVNFNKGLFSCAIVSQLDNEVEILSNYANKLDIKNEEIKYFQNNIVKLYDVYKSKILQNAYDEILQNIGMSPIFNNEPRVKVEYSKEKKEITIDDVVNKVVGKINEFYKI